MLFPPWATRFLGCGALAALLRGLLDMSLRLVGGVRDRRGRGMLRAAAWTCGLFAVGGGVVHLFPGPLTEPLVLIALGATMFFVSGRAPAPAREADDVGSQARTVATSRAVR